MANAAKMNSQNGNQESCQVARRLAAASHLQDCRQVASVTCLFRGIAGLPFWSSSARRARICDNPFAGAIKRLKHFNHAIILPIYQANCCRIERHEHYRLDLPFIIIVAVAFL
jgi:hypothetical protein